MKDKAEKLILKGIRLYFLSQNRFKYPKKEVEEFIKEIEIELNNLGER